MNLLVEEREFCIDFIQILVMNEQLNALFIHSLSYG